MINLKYLDDECHDGMEVRVFPSLEILVLHELPNIEGLLKVEIGDVFPCLSKLIINSCPKLGLPCLQSLNNLYVKGCNNELLRSISTFCGLTTLTLELPNQPFNIALEHLEFSHCDELELLPEQIWNSLQSLRTMWIGNCKGLRCLPEGIRHLTSLEVLTIHECPTLEERCKEGTGDDWDKIAHIPKLRLWLLLNSSEHVPKNESWMESKTSSSSSPACYLKKISNHLNALDSPVF
ncbi:NBS resistance protein [Trifolium pratense]|uniref:NBS resistance protein n=1 Tax=Trifolium pratense TaxID=57577 RepID=A0A2K3NVM3_TRIPR|nr:NBS resistance protein [Trifolium pratense]